MKASVPRALVLDYGNVLTGPQRAAHVARMAARLDVKTDAFATVYRAEREPYDAGEPPEAYWQRVVARLGRAAMFTPAVLAALIAEDSGSWMDYREEVWRIAATFRGRGGRTGFLSNNVPPLMASLRAEGRLDVFHVVTASCEARVTKPDAEIFRVCLDALGVAPEDALFVDDYAENVAAAERLGMRALQFQGEDAVARHEALALGG
jgi:putative hydrolase of the HAD superfamily